MLLRSLVLLWAHAHAHYQAAPQWLWWEVHGREGERRQRTAGAEDAGVAATRTDATTTGPTAGLIFSFLPLYSVFIRSRKAYISTLLGFCGVTRFFPV